MSVRVAVTAMLLLSCGGALGKGDKRGGPVTTPFDTKKAAALLGHPGEAFEQISAYQLPEIYWLRIGSGASAIGAPFIVHNGEVVTAKGYATVSAWLRRAVMPLEQAPDAEYVAQVLGAYEALPLGWSTAGASGHDAATGERGGLRLHPFELELVWPGYVHTTSRLRKAPLDGPPTPPVPPGGAAPSGAPPTPSGPPGGAVPSGGPPGAPGPAGGFAPAQPCRAILKEVDGKLTWIVEQHHAAIAEQRASWSLLLKEPIE